MNLCDHIKNLTENKGPTSSPEVALDAFAQSSVCLGIISVYTPHLFDIPQPWCIEGVQ